MKKFSKAITLLALLSVSVLGACGPEGSSSTAPSSVTPTSSTKGNSSVKPSSSTPEEEVNFVVAFKESNYEESFTANVTVGDSTAMLIPSMIDGTEGKFTYESADPNTVSVSTNGKLTIKNAGTVKVTIKDSTGSSMVVTLVATVATVSTGGNTLANASYDEKSRILASLEKYAVDNYLTGITIFSNGSKIAYNTRYTPQAPKYISGYGWGTTREGSFSAGLTKALSKEPTYYNVGTTQLPTHINAMNASGSDVSTVYDYISTSYYSTRMNQNNDGYEWYPSLATDEKPIPVNSPVLNDDGTVKTPGSAISTEDVHYNNNKRWRIYLRDDVVYRSGSDVEFSKGYDGQKVALEDYVTPLKFMLTGYNAQYRGAELTTGISGFKGASAYYAATSNAASGNTEIWDKEKWNKYMGGNIYTGTENGKNFIEFELLSPCTQFYAMYYLSSSLYSPLPESFIKYWGAKGLGKNPGSYTPCDTMLSTGPYYIKSWGKKLIKFAKNDQYFWKKDVFTTTIDGQTTTKERSVYNIDGIAYNEVEESSQLVNHFEAGEIDSYAPTATEMKAGGDFASETGSKGDVKWRLYETLGDSNFKLNVNAVDEKRWLNLFGPTGSIYQHSAGTYTTNNWTAVGKHETGVKPYMSNIHFLNFLSFAINRKEVCEARGSQPTQEYLSDNYLIDPENGISYNATEAHKAVLADRFNDTYGFNETYAKSELGKAFDECLDEMIENKEFNSAGSVGAPGSKENPYVIPIDMEWMNSTDKNDYSDVFTYINKIFSAYAEEVYDGGVKLEIQSTDGNSDYEEVYNLMRRGEFDLGFGSITGNSLNPLNFLEVLKSDNSSGFTLNWGPDTSKLGSGLYSGDDEYRNHVYYAGKEWSFDSLWQASDTGVVLDNSGAIAKLTNESNGGTYGTIKYQSTNSTDMSATFKLSFKQLVEAGASNIMLTVSNSAHSAEYAPDDLNLDSNYGFVLTLDNAYNKDEDGNEYNNVTVTVTFDAVLKDGNGNEISSENLTSYISLPTYTGITKK